MNSMKRTLLTISKLGLAAILLAACSRGGGAGAPPPPPPAQLTWDAPQLLENYSHEASNPQLAVDPAGNALVVWDMDADPTIGAESYIYANRYNATTGTWGASAQMIGTTSTSDKFPQIAVDAQGNGISVWEGSGNIHYTRYNAGIGTWGAVQSTTSTTLPVINAEPAVAMDSNGNAVVVWMEWSMSINDVSIKSRHYPTGGPGGSIVTLLTGSYPGTSYLMPQPQVAMDGQGNALAVWLHTSATNTTYHIVASRYTASTASWDPAAAIETLPENALYPRLAMNAAGEAIVVWRNQMNASEIGVYANRFSPSSGWLPAAELVSQQTVTTSNSFLVLFAEVDCAITTNGDSIVVYGDFDGASGIVFARRRTQTSGWAAAQRIYSRAAGITLFPQVAMDGSGNAVALWAQSTGAELELWSDNYVAGQGWSTAQRIGSGLGVSALSPFWPVALDGSGNAVAAWIQFSGGLPNVYANRGN